MKITAFESGRADTSGSTEAQARILPAEFRAAVHQPKGKARPKTSREEAIEVAMAAMEQVPDIREDQVNDIKARIERGEYKVSGSEVADMMVRRMKADQIR